jgi:hypothetical protein
MKTLSNLFSERSRENWAIGLFWGWNIIFIALVFLGFAPYEVPRLVQGVQAGYTPGLYLAFCLIFIAVPLAAVASAILFLRKDPIRLFALGYAAEWPVMLILLFRFLMIHQGNPAVTVLLIWTLVAESIFLWHLFDRRIEERGPFWINLRLSGLTLLFAGSLYAAIWLAFYIPIIGYYLWTMISNIYQVFNDIIINLQWRCHVFRTPQSMKMCYNRWQSAGIEIVF